MPRVEDKLKRIYYGPQGYWRGASTIKKLAAAARVSEETAKDWLKNNHLAGLSSRAQVYSQA